MADDSAMVLDRLSKVKNVKARIDSLWNYAELHTNTSEETVYLQEIIRLGERTDNRQQLARAYNCMARHIYNTMESTPDTLMYYLHKMEDLQLKDNVYKALLTDMNSYVCYAYIFQNMNGKALDITNEFLEKAEKDGDDYAKLTALEMLGTLYTHINQFGEAKKNFKSAYEIYKQNKDTFNDLGLQLQIEMGDVCLNTKDYDELRQIAMDMNECMKKYDRSNYGFYDHNYAMMEAYLAICDLSEGKQLPAQQHIAKSKSYRNVNDDYVYMLQRYSESMYYENLNQLAKAWELVKDNRFDATSNFFIFYKKDLMEKMEMWKEAATYRKELLASYMDETNLLLNNQMNEMRTKYDVSNLEVKNSQIAQQQAVIRSRFYAFIMGVMFILGGLLFYIFMRTRKDKKKIEIANKTQAAFLQNMSHEIRTPLNAICGFSQLLSTPDLRDILTDEEYMEYGEIIQSNTDLLTTLVTDILVSSDLESGKYQLNIHPCSANNICRRAVSTVKSRCPNHINLYFTSDIDENYRFESDEMRCQQILINYLTNAIKHTDKGEIHVHASMSEKPGFISFSVTDTGTGVPLDKAEAIFGRFEKLNTFKQGTGLGLNICKKLATLMHGEVFLDTSYTHGARFVFNHPCVA